MKLFDPGQKWYKGNLHTHTTLSDGLVDPEKCKTLYRDAGYDFLSITDHRKFYQEAMEENFLMLSGTEFDINDFVTRQAWHITAIGAEREVRVEAGFSPQDIINAINEANGLAIIAHPAWSLLTHENMMSLTGYFGIEVWNTVSEAYSGRGDSTGYLDVLASKGKVAYMLATDDTHFYREDLFGGYIMVNSSELSREAIFDSLRHGRFYCSQGPQIRQISVEKKRIMVETSPVESIAFMSDTFYCRDRICKKDPCCSALPAHMKHLENRAGRRASRNGCNDLACTESSGDLTFAEYEVQPTDRLVRIECRDRQGKRAWSQFIDVNK